MWRGGHRAKPRTHLVACASCKPIVSWSASGRLATSSMASSSTLLIPDIISQSSTAAYISRPWTISTRGLPGAERGNFSVVLVGDQARPGKLEQPLGERSLGGEG